MVFPLVADTTTDPRRSLPLRRSIASGETLSSRRPGSVVPPPDRVSRESRAAARAPATFAPKSTPQPSLERACISSWSIARKPLLKPIPGLGLGLVRRRRSRGCCRGSQSTHVSASGRRSASDCRIARRCGWGYAASSSHGILPRLCSGERRPQSADVDAHRQHTGVRLHHRTEFVISS